MDTIIDQIQEPEAAPDDSLERAIEHRKQLRAAFVHQNVHFFSFSGGDEENQEESVPVQINDISDDMLTAFQCLAQNVLDILQKEHGDHQELLNSTQQLREQNEEVRSTLKSREKSTVKSRGQSRQGRDKESHAEDTDDNASVAMSIHGHTFNVRNKTWDLSLDSLHLLIQQIHNKEQREYLVKLYNDLVKALQVVEEEHLETQIYYCLCYEQVIDAIEQMDKTAGFLKEKMATAIQDAGNAKKKQAKPKKTKKDDEVAEEPEVVVDPKEKYLKEMQEQTSMILSNMLDRVEHMWISSRDRIDLNTKNVLSKT